MIKDHYILSAELLRNDIENFDIYPFNLQIIKYFEKIYFDKNITFIIWENGSWKSTLLEAIAIQYWFNPEWWSKNFNFSTYETHSSLSQKIRIAKWARKPKDNYFLRAESFYNVASNIEELWWLHKYYWGKSLHEQSHWESFFSLFLHRLFGDGIYIFDEPEAALSPQRQLAFLIRMNELVKLNSQFIIATHSPIILSYPNAKILELSENGLTEVLYKETKHYELYKDFLLNPEYMIKKLNIT